MCCTAFARRVATNEVLRKVFRILQCMRFVCKASPTLRKKNLQSMEFLSNPAQPWEKKADYAYTHPQIAQPFSTDCPSEKNMSQRVPGCGVRLRSGYHQKILHADPFLVEELWAALGVNLALCPYSIHVYRSSGAFRCQDTWRDSR